MKIEFINKSEKKKIIEQLNEQFGITELPYLLVKSGKEKIRGYTGSLSKDEIKKLDQNIRIEGVGIYLIKEEVDGLRLSFDAADLLKGQIRKNIIEISKEDAEKWMKGNNLEIDENLHGIFAVKSGRDFLGCGKASGGRLNNFVPKERRRKN